MSYTQKRESEETLEQRTKDVLYSKVINILKNGDSAEIKGTVDNIKVLEVKKKII